jgi:hypothetical protein
MGTDWNDYPLTSTDKQNGGCGIYDKLAQEKNI